MSEKRVGRWLKDLKNVAYQMEDVLDQWRTEMLRVQIDQRRRLSEDDLEDGDHDHQGANLNNREVLSYLCSVFSCLETSWELSELPDSMCGLINLQTLKLKHCDKLIKLPKDIGRMIKLRNLDIRDSGLMCLPEGIRNWTSLQTLSTFIVSAADEGCKIEELKHLDHLKECLEIKGLGRLTSEEQAAEAEFHTKRQLTELQLDFDPPEGRLASSSSDSEIFQPSSEELEAVSRLMESVLGNLQPHANLKKMTWYYLMGVPPENQKITYYGALVKDDDDWWVLNLWIPEGCVQGIAVDEIVKAPEKGPVFMKDLQEEQSHCCGEIENCLVSEITMLI
ncbi:hypothetical protein C5167_044111 [Papaver somniferum]|uniref:Uncharacterized protein n=1 Tax=Papaver somniferum TaxID=3469 RepID=A0A4Y7L7P7_PAPSO|nr:hypothetical protein C5167_044111 [Papaver somniferum]